MSGRMEVTETVLLDSQLTRHCRSDQRLTPLPKKTDLSPNGLACPHTSRKATGQFLGDGLRLIPGRDTDEKASDLLEVESWPVSSDLRDRDLILDTMGR